MASIRSRIGVVMVVFNIVGAVVIFVSGMVTMGIVASKGRYEATTEAYKIGYEKGVNAEKERIGNLLDKYIEDLERGKRRDSEGVSIADNIS